MALPSRADRNLLFGILALEMDFITRDGLVGAMQAWVFAKEKPLGQLLVEQGDLPPGRKDLLEALVEEHLKTHRGDVQASLAAAHPPNILVQDLRAIGDAELEASLAAAPSQQGQNPESTGPFVAEPECDAALRYQPLRLHAKGGLGEVFVAFDQELQREVALKQIKERYAHDSGSRSRFLLEAEITGALEHPGIVPVYGLGSYADGRPFYAMRFIRGQTLKEAIQAFHAADKPGRDSGERRLAFRQLLRRFIDACNAVAYAHSRGVLHRDIKPANIMLGPYGETLVVDWGLAKAVGRSQANGISEERTLRPAASGNVAETVAGTALGTPAYMSPEQASGRRDSLSPATDVYSLGATLYTLLTGSPPIGGNDAAEVLRRAQRGEFLSPRHANPTTPAALEAVCLKAIALNPEERYSDALSLAADVEHWLADEPVSAWREPFAARCRRWIRRHQSLVGSATAATLVLLLCLAIGLGIVSDAYRQEKEARQEAATQEEEAHRQQRIAEGRAERIEEHFRADRQASDQIAAVIRGTMPVEMRLDRQDQWRSPEYRAIRFGRTRDADLGFEQDLAAKYQTIATSLGKVGKRSEAAAWFDKSESLAERLAAAHQDDRILALDLAEHYLQRAQFEAEGGNAERARDVFLKAMRVEKESLQGDPTGALLAEDLILYLNTAGEAFQVRKDTQAALAFHRLALGVTERASQAKFAGETFLLGVARTHNGIGLCLRTLSKPAEGLTHHEKARAALEALSVTQTRSADRAKALATTHHLTALAFIALGKTAEALRRHEKAVSLREKLANPNGWNVAFTLELADEYRAIYCLYRDAGDQATALRWCERAAGRFSTLAEDYPSLTWYGFIRDEMLQHRAVSLARLGRHEEATHAARELLATRQTLSGGLYNLACVFAVAAGKARHDCKLAEPERKRLALNYEGEAIRLLRQAEAAGYFKHPGTLAEMKNDKDLQSLQSRTEFKELAASLEAGGGAGGRSGGIGGRRD